MEDEIGEGGAISHMLGELRKQQEPELLGSDEAGQAGLEKMMLFWKLVHITGVLGGQLPDSLRTFGVTKEEWQGWVDKYGLPSPDDVTQ